MGGRWRGGGGGSARELTWLGWCAEGELGRGFVSVGGRERALGAAGSRKEITRLFLNPERISK